jgi:hypothetical protein
LDSEWHISSLFGGRGIIDIDVVFTCWKVVVDKMTRSTAC